MAAAKKHFRNKRKPFCAGALAAYSPALRQVFQIFKRLTFRFIKTLSEGFMLNKKNAFPEKINRAGVLIIFFDGFLKNGNLSAFDAKDV